MKVLLFSNDLMPFGNLPTSGGGLRCYQLMRGLQAHGVEVIASMPGFTFLAEKHAKDIPEEQREWLWQWHTQDEILKRAKPDAVLFASNWDHIGLTGRIDVPLIEDLHGSRLIETTMWNAPISTDQKVKTLGRADCLLCAGVRQRSYFYGWLMQAGRVPADEHFIRYIPISLGPDQPVRELPDPSASEHPLFVSGGGWFPWQNQSKTIFSICSQIVERDRGTIQIYGTPHETATISPEEQVIRNIYGQVRALSERSSRVQVKGYVGRNDLIEIYRRASVAVENMKYNLERELAFTTRTIEYLWCGLPVLYNNYAEISDHIAEYDAGWAIDPTSDQAITETINQIFDDPEAIRRKSANAQRLVRDRFTWDRTILPLLEFLKNPTRVKPVEPVLGTIVARPSFLSPRGLAVDVGMTASQPVLRQEFIVPAENILTLSLPAALASEDARSAILSVTLRVTAVDAKGQTSKQLALKKYLPEELPLLGQLSISFPSLRIPKGGKKLQLEVRVAPKAEKGDSNLILVQGLLSAGFPFVATAGNQATGQTLLGEDVEIKALAVSFVPGSGQLYRIKYLAERGFAMLRQGEWRRLSRAFFRRLPRVWQRLRNVVLQGS